jgi:UrcA family protein
MKNLFKTQSGLTKFVLVAGFVAFASAAIGETALAQPIAAEAASEVSYPVRYSDLDLSTTQGSKVLYLRIRYAAETLCESTATWGKKAGEACVHKAINDAVARVDAPLLTQYAQLRSKGDRAGLVQVAKAN